MKTSLRLKTITRRKAGRLTYKVLSECLGCAKRVPSECSLNKSRLVSKIALANAKRMHIRSGPHVKG
jgi:hypothetical protein